MSKNNIAWKDKSNPQELFDSYNRFIMSNDRKVFFKLIERANLYSKVKDLHGDIVECGVFKGAGMLAWLKLIDMYQPHSIKKVIGFDFFDPSFVDNLKNDLDRINMKHVFNRDPSLDWNAVSLARVNEVISSSGFDDDKFHLVKGDISVTCQEYIADRPGFRISLLYLDLDLEEPTYNTLCAFWERVVPGGVVVFDEYGIHTWSEANAVDRFLRDKNLKLINTNIFSPSAYVIKE